MKRTPTLYRILILLGLCIAMTAARAQYISIPDTAFGSWLKTRSYGACMTGSSATGWLLDTVCARNTLDTIPQTYPTYVLDLSHRNLHDLTGFHYLSFTILYGTGGSDVIIDLSHNNFSRFPVEMMNPYYFTQQGGNHIDLSYNHIDSVYYNFEYTVIGGGGLDRLTLNLSHNGLQSFSCLSCGVPGISGLAKLDLSYNNLDTLPRMGSTQFGPMSLYARHNQFHRIPAGYYSTIDVGANQIDSANAFGYFTSLRCDSNNMTSFKSPVYAFTTLDTLDISHNNITNFRLSYLNHTVPVTVLKCNDNNITSLPQLAAPLSYLDCHNNPNLKCLPPLPFVPALYVDINTTLISCLPNRYSACTYTGSAGLNALPICNYCGPCTPYHMIEGVAYFDSIQNCRKDASERTLPDVEISLLGNNAFEQMMYTDAGGNYGFTMADTGSFTLTGSDTLLFSGCMSNGGAPVHFQPLDSNSVNVNYGLTCKPGFDLAALSIETGIRVARNSDVHINAGDLAEQYHMSCAHNVSGTVSLILSGPLVYVSPYTGALTPTSVNGDTISWVVANFGTINDQNDFNVVITTDSTATAGQQACMTLIVTPVSGDIDTTNNILTQCFVLKNSHDPNEKSVSPVAGIPQSQKWLTYTVNFQNTGNDTAYNVYIQDTLDAAHLNVSTLQYLGSSASCITQVLDGGIARFNFSNIDLVDSAASATRSTGWVQYRIQLLPNLPAGTTIKNTASIYFDQNPAVVTNTTINTINTPLTCADTTISMTHAICQGDTFVFAGRHLTTAATYRDTLARAGGCDSIFVLTLTVHTLPVVTFTWDSMEQRHYLAPRLPSHTIAAYCQLFYHDTLVPLIGGLPAGGVYSGDRVRNDTLNLNYFSGSTSYVDSVFYTFTDNNGCSVTVIDSILPLGCDGISDVANNTIHLYPNPNQGSFTLQTSNGMGMEYAISDMLGHVIEQKMITSDTQAIDMREAAEGVYTLVVKGAQPIRFTIVR